VIEEKAMLFTKKNGSSQTYAFVNAAVTGRGLIVKVN